MKYQTATFDITNKCNLACEFCYSNSDKKEKEKAISFENLKELVDKTDAGIYEISGGEPFLHSELENIVNYISSKGKKVDISTNGTFVPKWFLNLDSETKKNVSVQVSLHAANSKTYKEITGKNSFEKVLKNIGLLKDSYPTEKSFEADVEELYNNLIITSAIYSKNFNEVPALIKLARTLEVPIRINVVFPVGSGKNVELLTTEQFEELQDYLLAESVRTKGMVVSPLTRENNCPVLEKTYNSEKRTKCPAEHGNKIYININGDSQNCEFLGD